MNKFAHGLVLAVFGIGCWFLWAILTFAERSLGHLFQNAQLPAFTRLCLGLKPVTWVMLLVAVAYCLFVWVRKSDGQKTWMGFFATAMSALMLLSYPVILALVLPLISLLQQIPRSSP
jgi:hypothetical protein